MDQTDKKINLEWIELLRYMAILCVVLCHVTEEIYRLNIDDVSRLSLQSKGFAFTTFTLGRLGVPIFLLISGYLLLDRDYNAVKCKKFWRNNWLRLLICTEIWFVIYDIFLLIYSKQIITFAQIVMDLLFLHRVGLSHVWYMPMILGMYILIPIVANGLKSFEITDLKFPLLFFSTVSFGYPFVQVVNNVCGGGNTIITIVARI